MAAPMAADPLLEPFRLRHLVLKNRIMSTSHATAYGPSVDGSLLARDFWTVMQCWSVLPSVRPVFAALLDGRWP